MGSVLWWVDNFQLINFNCSPTVPGAPHACDFGIIYGPAVTVFDATFGIIFGQSTTLPVQLVQFLATKNDDGSVKIGSATSQEENCK